MRPSTEIQAVQQEPEDYESLQDVVNQISLLCREIPLPGMVREPQDGELKEDEGTEKACKGSLALRIIG